MPYIYGLSSLQNALFLSIVKGTEPILINLVNINEAIADIIQDHK